MTIDMPEPCECPCLDCCQRRFLWANKDVDLAPHPVIGLVLLAGAVEKLFQALGFKAGMLFSKSASWVHVEDGGAKRLVQLEIACDADGFASPCLIWPLLLLLRQS